MAWHVTIPPSWFELTGIAAELNPGGLLSFAQEIRSLEILTQQVMPAFK